MNNFSQTSSVESEWKEARSRLDLYLRALNLANPDRQERIIQAVLHRAASKYAEHPEESPTALAMNEMREFSDKWLEKVMPSPERATSQGLVSLYAIDVEKKWPAAFLAEEVPVEFRQTLQRSEVRAAPDLSVSRMVPQPFESPLSDMNLPSALTQLTKDLSPSLVAKATAFILSGIAFLSGNRMR